MKIAMIGQKGIPAVLGGVERHVEELSARLAARGHEVTVFCRPYYTSHRGQWRGVRLVLLPSIRTKHLDAITHTAFATASALTGEYDILHYHAIGPSSLSFLPRMLGKRVVATVHALDWLRRKWGAGARTFLKIGEVVAARFPNEVITVSRLLQERFRKVHRRETHYIPNGVILGRKRPVKELSRFGLESGKYVLYLGRFVPEKACHVLVEAFRGLRTDMKLALVGDTAFSGDYLRSLQDAAKGDSRIVFTGAVQGQLKDEAFSNAALFVLPSELEGLPIALLEALSYGTCVLASDIPENVEALRDGNGALHGELFRAGSVDSLRMRISDLLESPGRRRAIGESGREFVLRTYDWDEIARTTEQIYHQATGGW